MIKIERGTKFTFNQHTSKFQCAALDGLQDIYHFLVLLLIDFLGQESAGRKVQECWRNGLFEGESAQTRR